MRLIECEQGSAEWLQLRCGRITASRICDVMARLKGGGEAAARRNYRMDLLAERLTGRSENYYVSLEMAWGTEQEPFARTAYELANDVMLSPAGFIVHPTLDYSGASPDSLVGEEGGLELKCPKTTTHLAWRLAGVVPEEHQEQMFWNMVCADRGWWDFASYDPRLPEPLRLFVVRLPRHDARIAEIERDVVNLHQQVEALMDRLGAPPWLPMMRNPDAELNACTEKIGELDVPEDLARIFSEEIVP